MCCYTLCVIGELYNNYERSLEYLRESLTWFPRNISALFRYACLLKPFAKNDVDLLNIENIFRKAVVTKVKLKTEKNANISNVSTHPHNLVDKEIESGENAQDALILLLCQNNRFIDASPFLIERGFKVRLSKEVIHIIYFLMLLGELNYNLVLLGFVLFAICNSFIYFNLKR